MALAIPAQSPVNPPPPAFQTRSENDAESLKQGLLFLSKHRQELTILVVGETGVGKTTLLSYIANILSGRTSEDYVEFHDLQNEAGGSQSGSQTNQARLYKFKSRNGITLRILDTPGLADTRGLAQDAKHKKSIADTIQKHVDSVHAVLILANGTVPRLGVATDYALSTLSAIFPRTLAANIGILFTNVDNVLAWNFEGDSIPPILSNANQFLINNPVAIRKKYVQVAQKGGTAPKVLKKLHQCVKEGEQDALETLADLFNWTDSLSPQPTKDILTLYNQTQAIETNMTDAIARMHQATEKKQEVHRIVADLDKAKVDMNTFKNFEAVISKQIHVQDPTSDHNTVCTATSCYSNCHISCGLDFTFNSTQLAGCVAMDDEGTTCNECGHHRDVHRHFRTLWILSTKTETSIDYTARANFMAAQSSKQKKEQLLQAAQAALGTLTTEIEALVANLGCLAEEYAKLSLSGNFAGQVEKSVKLLETNLESMRQNGSDRETIKTLEESLEKMTQKLELLRKAKATKGTRGVWSAVRSFVG